MFLPPSSKHFQTLIKSVIELSIFAQCFIMKNENVTIWEEENNQLLHKMNLTKNLTKIFILTKKIHTYEAKLNK